MLSVRLFHACVRAPRDISSPSRRLNFLIPNRAQPWLKMAGGWVGVLFVLESACSKLQTSGRTTELAVLVS